ncbi:MAG: N-acetylmuramic acid 6-phosphate etherase [Gemmatimonadales bacterium]
MTDPASPIRATERRNPRSAAVDTFDAAQLVALFVAEDSSVPLAVGRESAAIAAAMTLIETAFRRGGRLFYIGAGTSGRLGVLDASECPPTFGTPPSMVQGIIAGGYDALVRSVEGAEDDRDAGTAAIDERALGSDDVLVGIAASGTTPLVRGALVRARARGAATVFVTCAAPSTDVVPHCDVIIQVDVGPEIVTGSTRLKAGTATKLVLNMLTTGAMIRIGKTYGNLMVDLQATNAKLRERGERIVMEVLGASRESAASALQAAGGRVRTAIVMLHDHLDAVGAEARLTDVDRRLRAIVGPPPEVTQK